MQRAIVLDFSRVLLFPKDTTYVGSLNEKHKSLSEKPNYYLLEHFSLNEKLLERLSTLKHKYRLYIFTSETIQDDPSLQPYLSPLFDGIYSAMRLGIDKKTPSSYDILAKEIGLSPREIVYVDDNLENFQAAQNAGTNCIHYKNNLQLLSQLPN
jgi:HAD superfamily hydrolase (TIGR01509 family)